MDGGKKDFGYALPNYDTELQTCGRFLKEYRDYDAGQAGMGQDAKYGCGARWGAVGWGGSFDIERMRCV
jgi:hypothetical protein